MVPGVSLKMIQDDRIWQSYMQCGMMLWHLLTSFFALSLLLKSLFLFFLWPLLHNAQTKIAIVYMREQTCDTRYDSNICTTMIWYVCYGKYRSLMCTSNVAGNTQMASIDRQVTQNRLRVINSMAREYTMEGYHNTKMIWRLPSVAMMSGGVLDVESKMMETRP